MSKLDDIFKLFTDRELQDDLNRSLTRKQPKTSEQYEIWVEHLNTLSDSELWIFVNENKDKIKIILDNDDTYFYFIDDEDSKIVQFDWYLGCSDGILLMMNSLGFIVEEV